jgi:DNA repair exonuclease SbcCD nuclease subunit
MSDSHLGFQDLNKVDEKGRNIIEEMVYSGFSKTINKIIELKPDAVVHAGDVFHRERPGIRPLYEFKKGMERLIDAGIPVIIINGNHDAPKSNARTSPFCIYERMKGLNITHREKYKYFEIGDHIFHCMPYCTDENDRKSEFSKIKCSKRDVLIMHGMVKSMWSERRNDVGEYELDDSFLKSDFDYIALGHSHRQRRVNDNTWYSGSVECFSFDEAWHEKGILLVDLSTGDVKPIKIYESKYRIDYPYINCLGLSSDDIVREIFKQCSLNNIKDKIVRCNLKDVDRDQYKKINPSNFSDLRRLCIDLKITPEFKEEKRDDLRINTSDLSGEFTKFIRAELEKISYKKEMKDKIINYGSDLINNVEKARNTERGSIDEAN